MRFDVTSATDLTSRTWDDLHARLPAEWRDLHASRPYMAAAAHLGVQPFLAYCEAPDGSLAMLPFVLRRSTLFWEDVVDIESAPMGYGGPVLRWGSQLCAVEAYHHLRRELTEWARGRGVVTEHCILNPMLHPGQSWLYMHPRGRCVGVTSRKAVAVIEVERVLWRYVYRKDRLPAITKLWERGYRASELYLVGMGPGANRTALATFADFHARAMERKGAAEQWRLPRAHLEDLSRLASIHQVTRPGSGPLAMAMVLRDHRTAYYHLAARSEENVPGVSDMLIDHCAEHAHQSGCTRLHLGGGLTTSPDDSLLRYKREFTDVLLPVLSYFEVVDHARHDHLVELKRKHELEVAGRLNDASMFQPIYRRPDPASKEAA